MPRRERHRTAAAATVIHAAIYYHAEQPRLEAGFAPKIADARQQLEKRILCDIQSRRMVPGVAQRNGVNPILMGFKQRGEGVPLATLASLDRFAAIAVHDRHHAHLPN